MIKNYTLNILKILLFLLLWMGVSTSNAGNITSYEFNGTDESIYLKSASDFNVTTDWTFEAWINVDGISGWDDFMFRDDIFSFQVKAPLGTGNFALDFYNRDNASELSTDAAEDLTFGTWYHVAATFNGTTAKLYVNEIEVDSDPIAANWSLVTNTNHLNIGARYSGGYGNYYDGEIDEIRISDIARDIADMQTNYSREKYVSDGNTLLLMHFDDGVSPPTYVSGSGYSGLVYNNNTGTLNYVYESIAAVSLLRPNYQTQITGNWDDASIWQYYNGSSVAYENASLTPDYYDNDIYILNGHTVTINEDVEVNQVTVKDGAMVSVADGKEMTLHLHNNNGMTVEGDVTVDGTLTIDSGSPFIITSNASSQGSVINRGAVTGNANVECFTTSGKWHGISAPVDNQTATVLYQGGNPDVWIKYYNESDRTYSYVGDISTDLEDMKGWMLWIDGSEDIKFKFDGAVRTGTVGTIDNLIRTSAGEGYGYNFVGNPFTSAIDWDADNGWTKSNIEEAIYVYNDGNWDTYINGAGANDGSRYIAMNQGFFVQVSDGGSYPENGTLQMTSDVCVHNDIEFRDINFVQQLIRLQLTDNGLTDETVIRITDDATEGWDANLDAHKMFSFNENYPQIYSTANGSMSINSLPRITENISLDVIGVDGNQMTISATEFGDYSQIFLYDEYLDELTDLTKNDYTFAYLQNITDRFYLSFLFTDIKDNPIKIIENFYTYSQDKEIKVVLNNSTYSNISIYNLLGQKIISKSFSSNEIGFTVDETGFYIVAVSNVYGTSTQKIFVK